MVAQARKIIPITHKTTTKQEPEPLSITLPLPPSLNNSYRDVIYYDKKTQTMRVRRVSTSDLLAFQEAAAWRLAEQRIPRGGWAAVEAVGYISQVYVPTAASDLDNRNKHWQDAVSSWLGFNDNKIQDCYGAFRRIDPANPRVEIQLFPVRKARKFEVVEFISDLFTQVNRWIKRG